jgi:ERCC4-type nuclease
MQLEGHSSYIDIKRSGKSIQDHQLSLIGSLPDVGPKLAERLLKEFKTLRKVFSSKKLDRVEGLGKKKAEKIQELLDKEFKN